MQQDAFSQVAYFDIKMATTISPATKGESKVGSQGNEGNDEDKPSTPTPVTFGSPLTPLDAVDLSTPQEPQCRRSLFLENDDFVGKCKDVLDKISVQEENVEKIAENGFF